MHGCHGRVEGSRDTWEKGRGGGGEGGEEVEGWRGGGRRGEEEGGKEVEGRRRWKGERKEEGGGRLGGVSLVYTTHTMSTDSSVCDMLTAMLFGLR